MLNTRDDPLATAMDNALAGRRARQAHHRRAAVDPRRAQRSASPSTPTPRPSCSAAQHHPARPRAAAAADRRRDQRSRLSAPKARRSTAAASRTSSPAATPPPRTRSATPLGGILSDDDPRFTLQPKEAYLGADLRRAARRHRRPARPRRARAGAGRRLRRGSRRSTWSPRTLGALPAREPDVPAPTPTTAARSFTADRSPRTVCHDGAADQAIVRMTWPTRDDSDFGEELELELLERVMRLELTRQAARGARPDLFARRHRHPVRRLSRLRHVHDQRPGRRRPRRGRARRRCSRPSPR